MFSCCGGCRRANTHYFCGVFVFAYVAEHYFITRGLKAQALWVKKQHFRVSVYRYNVTMPIHPSYGVTRNRTTTTIALIGAAMIVLMLVAQLFGYEDFSIVLSDITAINDARSLSIISAAIVIAELLALPYLLAMYMSRLMRVVSALLAFGVSGFWLLSSLTNSHSENSALFSSTADLAGGLLAALWAFTLFACICRVIYSDSRFRHVAP